MPVNTPSDIQSIDSLIGKTILSRRTGNKLGEISDLIVEPAEGLVLGLAAYLAEDNLTIIDSREISSFGEDAVMVSHDAAQAKSSDSTLSGLPLAKKNLIGAKIITEGGKLLGEVANIFIFTAHTPYSFFYQIQESLLDRLLRRTIFIPASESLAVSDRAERIIVPHDTLDHATDNLDILASLATQPQIEGGIIVRGLRSPALQAFRTGRLEFSEMGEEQVINKQPRIVEEVLIHKEQRGRTELIKDSLLNQQVTIERIDNPE